MGESSHTFNPNNVVRLETKLTASTSLPEDEKEKTGLFERLKTDEGLSRGTQNVINMLREAISDLESGQRHAQEAVILFVDRENYPFHLQWDTSGVTTSTAVGICHIASTQLQDLMFNGPD